MQKGWFAIFKVKVTARAHMIRIWQFLLCFLNCWTFYNQTWYGEASLWARLSFKKIGFLFSRSRSQLRIIIIIHSLTTRVIWAPQMISQLFSSIFPCYPLPSGTWWTAGLSIPWCCLPPLQSLPVRDNIIKIWLLNILSEALILLQLNLVGTICLYSEPLWCSEWTVSRPVYPTHMGVEDYTFSVQIRSHRYITRTTQFTSFQL